MSKKIYTREQSLRQKSVPVKIYNWEQLSKQESENYEIKVDFDYCRGWIKPKVNIEVTNDNYYDHNVYLSTHTFYKEHYKSYTKVLQDHGFNVELVCEEE